MKEPKTHIVSGRNVTYCGREEWAEIPYLHIAEYKELPFPQIHKPAFCIQCVKKLESLKTKVIRKSHEGRKYSRHG